MTTLLYRIAVVALSPLMVLAQVSTTVIWADLDNRTLSQDENIQINSSIFDDFHVNAPSGRIKLNDRGLEFHTAATDDMGDAPAWMQLRAELRDNPMSTVNSNKTQVYEYFFEFDHLPTLDGPVTIFQRFHSGNDGPDIDIELRGSSQFPGSNPPNGSVLIHAFGGGWTLTNTMLKDKNHLMVAIYSASSGHYKVSLNGETLVEDDDNTTPDQTYSGPQFGIYNHGETPELIQRTDSKYIITEYDGEADFSQLNSTDPNEETASRNDGRSAKEAAAELALGATPWRIDADGNVRVGVDFGAYSVEVFSMLGEAIGKVDGAAGESCSVAELASTPGAYLARLNVGTSKRVVPFRVMK